MTLSPKDQEILNKILNRTELKIALILYCVFKASLLYLVEEDTINDDSVDLIMPKDVKMLEIEAINLAESSSEDSLLKSLNLIDKAIGICEKEPHPSLLNNKAQILRLMGRNEEALQILNTILSNDAQGSKNILKQSSAQRGWLHFRSGRNEAAFVDFERAGKLGCLQSRRMAVRCNPYAAMCNQMLQEIIETVYYTNNNSKDDDKK